MLDFDELQEFPKVSSWATKSDFISDLMGTQNHQKKLVRIMIARFTMYGYLVANSGLSDSGSKDAAKGNAAYRNDTKYRYPVFHPPQSASSHKLPPSHLLLLM